MGSSNGIRAFILSIGDELTAGLTVDTNSARFSHDLAGIGIRTVGHATVGDDQPAIERTIREAAGRCELLLISGGIGPTPDDLTREALAAVLGRELVIHDAWVEQIRRIWSKRNREMPEGNRKQAGAPRGTDLLDNPVGTAAGVGADVDGCRLFVIPGVPKEAFAMLDRHVLPWARVRVRETGGNVIRTRALHTFGMGESDLAERLGDLLERGRLGDHLDVGTTAARGVVSVRIYARCPGEPEACDALDGVEARVRERLGDLVFGVDDQDLPQSVARTLRDHPRQPIVSLAESCTGGLIAKLLTDVPGSSAHFHRAMVTYSNAAKIELLGVPREIINEHGAVSEPVAKAMAAGARVVEGHGIALSVTGVAGPGGGSEAKPVGTVCLGLAAPSGDPAHPPYTFARTWRFHGDREMIRLRSAYMALTLLRLHLLGHDLEKQTIV
jgi:nicotinamide-nucleotide amidase